MTPLDLKMCDIQGRLFVLSVTYKINSEEFIKAFMNSEVAAGLDAPYNRMQWAGEEYLLEELEATNNFSYDGKCYPPERMYWIGYLYRYWHVERKISSKKIIKEASPKTMNQNYLMFHTMAPEMAIEDLEEMKRQKDKKRA